MYKNQLKKVGGHWTYTITHNGNRFNTTSAFLTKDETVSGDSFVQRESFDSDTIELFDGK